MNDLAIIKKETEKVLKKSFSRIKAIKAASDAAKTGETIDDNALRMTLDAEKRSLLDTMKTLQGQNNARYSNALLNLRDFKAGGLGVSPYLVKDEFKMSGEGRYYRTNDSYKPNLVVFRNSLDKSKFKLHCNFTVYSEPNKTKQNVDDVYSVFLGDYSKNDQYGTFSLAPIRLSKKVKAGIPL